MRRIPTLTTYLEMRSPDARANVPRGNTLTVETLTNPALDEYRQLYSAVGQDFRWVDRVLMPDNDLRLIIHDDRVGIFVLMVDGQRAGYVELDRRIANEVELAYFGLIPRFRGRGLGRSFLAWAIEKAWAYKPNRVWLHTCDLDHPAALPNYLKAGFQIYDKQVIQQPIPDDDPRFVPQSKQDLP